MYYEQISLHEKLDIFELKLPLTSCHINNIPIFVQIWQIDILNWYKIEENSRTHAVKVASSNRRALLSRWRLWWIKTFGKTFRKTLSTYTLSHHFLRSPPTHLFLIPYKLSMYWLPFPFIFSHSFGSIASSALAMLALLSPTPQPSSTAPPAASYIPAKVIFLSLHATLTSDQTPSTSCSCNIDSCNIASWM